MAMYQHPGTIRNNFEREMIEKCMTGTILVRFSDCDCRL
jgi:hypothetical protein